LFFALWPAAGWSSPLAAAANPWIEQAGARGVLAADLHVTLCFLGSVDDSRLGELRERVARVPAPAFTLQFDRIEVWRKARVIVAACGEVPDCGMTLAESLARAASELGLAPDHKLWRPHITLARSMLSKRLPAQMPLGALLPTPLTFCASSFCLAESLANPRPARYARLGSWPMGAPSPGSLNDPAYFSS
jgi:2'-5' RNA ligase